MADWAVELGIKKKRMEEADNKFSLNHVKLKAPTVVDVWLDRYSHTSCIERY